MRSVLRIDGKEAVADGGGAEVGDLKNELVWSYSRSRAFYGCPRAYWLQYYGSWGGWDAAAPPETRAAYLQKKLTSRAMWIGTRVHSVAEGVLKDALAGRALPTVDVAKARVRGVAAADIAGSASGAWLQRPARRTGFGEHYYGESVDDAEWEAAIAEIERQVSVLFGHRIFRRLLAVGPRVRQVEVLQRFRVDDAEVYVALDVLVEDGKGGVTIIDWKTGSAHAMEEIAAQLGVYGLYVTQELGVPDDQVTAMHVNTRYGTETTHRVDAVAIASARSLIASSIAAMREKLSDILENKADREAFPCVPLGDAACARCSFRRTCERE